MSCAQSITWQEAGTQPGVGLCPSAPWCWGLVVLPGGGRGPQGRQRPLVTSRVDLREALQTPHRKDSIRAHFPQLHLGRRGRTARGLTLPVTLVTSSGGLSPEVLGSAGTGRQGSTSPQRLLCALPRPGLRGIGHPPASGRQILLPETQRYIQCQAGRWDQWGSEAQRGEGMGQVLHSEEGTSSPPVPGPRRPSAQG